MNKNTKVIYKRIEEDFYDKGYINLNHRLVNTKDDLVEIASIFRDERYETFRVVFMKGNNIVGYESITSKMPNYVHILKPDKRGIRNAERCYNKFLSRMNRLSADGYYLVHNHPSDNAKASEDDIRTTKEFADKVKGFKGHLIVNTTSYAWIDIKSNGIASVENNISLKEEKLKEMENLLKTNPIYDVKILSRDDFVSLMHNIKNSKDYSIAILTDCQGRVKMVLDIPNRMLNMPSGELKSYFQNISRVNGSTRVFFATNDEEIFCKAEEHLEYGTFKDVVYYKKTSVKGNMLVTEFSQGYGRDLFADNWKSRIIKEDEEEYEFEKKEKELRILLKRFGRDPEVKIIENTLKAKQMLVGGLIEVIPYGDVLLVCNEEGKLFDFPPNLRFDYDYIAGDCFVVGDDYENADFRSLTDEEIEKYTKDLKERSFNVIFLGRED